MRSALTLNALFRKSLATEPIFAMIMAVVTAIAVTPAMIMAVVAAIAGITARSWHLLYWLCGARRVVTVSNILGASRDFKERASNPKQANQCQDSFNMRGFVNKSR